MCWGKAGQKSYSAHLGQNGSFNFTTSCDEVNFRVPWVIVSFNSCHGGRNSFSQVLGLGGVMWLRGIGMKRWVQQGPPQIRHRAARSSGLRDNVSRQPLANTSACGAARCTKAGTFSVGNHRPDPCVPKAGFPVVCGDGLSQNQLCFGFELGGRTAVPEVGGAYTCFIPQSGRHVGRGKIWVPAQLSPHHRCSVALAFSGLQSPPR